MQDKEEWKDSPGRAVHCGQRRLEHLLLAEDLGVITPDVDELREDFGLMGMKVLQFAGDYEDPYLPHDTILRLGHATPVRMTMTPASDGTTAQMRSPDTAIAYTAAVLDTNRTGI